jgi:hypothetical protein
MWQENKNKERETRKAINNVYKQKTKDEQDNAIIP